MNVLAYTPFVDALRIHDQWYLLIIPITVFIAIGYKAIRVPDMKDYAREVLIFIVQVLVMMAIVAAGLTLVISVLIPMLAPMAS